MRKIYFKQLLTALLLLCSTIASAEDFEVEGIYYNITDATAKTVEVTDKDSYSNEYCDTVTIPSSVTYRGVTYTVTSIGYEAFYCCDGLTSIEIPNSVTSIGERAFICCSGLTSIVIPNSVATIEKNAFYDCTSLKELYIEDGTTTLSLKNQSYITEAGYYPIFYNCPLETLYLGRNLSYKLKNDDGKTVISPFSNQTKLSSVNIGKDVTIIYYYMFYGCSNLKTISIPNNVKEISSCVFEGCTSLKKVVFEDGNEPLILGDNSSSVGLFGYCPLATCYIGRNLSYSTSPFYNFYRDYNTYLENITISNFVTVLPKNLFDYCSALISVTIPSSVTTIENYAFGKCCSLTEITSLIPAESLYELSSFVFRDVDKNACTLYVPAGAKATYEATGSWKEFTNIVELPASFDLTISAAKYATLYLDYNAVIPAGVRVYYAEKIEGETLMMERINDVIPANTAIIVTGAAGTYTFEQTFEKIAAIENNLFRGSVEDTYITPEKGTKYYVLSIVDGVVGMYLDELAGGTFKNNAHKAYLPLDGESLGIFDTTVNSPSAQLSNRYTFNFGGTTAVEVVNAEKASEAIYNLNGVRVENPTKGIYIVNGKKVVY